MPTVGIVCGHPTAFHQMHRLKEGHSSAAGAGENGVQQ